MEWEWEGSGGVEGGVQCTMELLGSCHTQPLQLSTILVSLTFPPSPSSPLATGCDIICERALTLR